MYSHMPYIAFLACLAMVYIANAHKGEKMMREIQALEKKEKQARWRAHSEKAKTSQSSTMSEVESEVYDEGLRVPVTPPKKLIVK